MIYIACDHGGVELKNAIIAMLNGEGVAVTDLGTNSDQSVDYPDYGYACAKAVAKATDALGIVICKTGVGMSICANKVNGIRCALCTSVEMARLCRTHNNANMLALGASNTTTDVAIEMVRAFLTSSFEGGRHAARVNKIMAHEVGNE